jgi:signal transduction histidine kinase
MNQQRKNRIIAILEQILPVVLAVVCVLVMTLNTHQSNMAIPLPLNFEGEYSFDGGSTWKTLTPSSNLSTARGDLLLRGHFDADLFPGGILYLYRDHFGISIKTNGQLSYMSIQSEILTMGEAGKAYLADTCGREWTMIALEEGLLHTDTVEIHLQKMHDYIDPQAYRNFLKSCYVGPIDTMIVESYLQPHVTHWSIFGSLLLILAVMLLGAAIAAATFQTSIVQHLGKLGFLLLFAGGYLLLDTITISFLSETRVFNTYARQICMMLAVYWMGLDVRDTLTGPRHRIAKVVLGISLALNTILILPSFLDAWALYDTFPVWAAGQLLFTFVLMTTIIWEVLRGERKNRPELYSCLLLMITLLLDIAGIGSSMYSHGTCTKISFTLVFVVHGFRALKRVLVDYQEARRAKKLEKELEDSRIAIMLSQMQPHFIHNILNVIYYMCGKDPAVAQLATSKFSDYLRNNLEALSQKELISFRKELDHIHTYLELEQIRFGEELSIVYDIEEDSFLLPVLSIQPLVENAVKHGIAKKRGGGVVTIASRQTGNAYQITVSDTGAGFDTAHYLDDCKVHVGLMNVRQRLASLMNATVEIDSTPGSGTTVTVTIPKEKVSQ